MNIQFSDVVQVSALALLALILSFSVLPLVRLAQRGSFSFSILIYFEINIHLLICEILDGFILLLNFLLFQYSLQAINIRF